MNLLMRLIKKIQAVPSPKFAFLRRGTFKVTNGFSVKQAARHSTVIMKQLANFRPGGGLASLVSRAIMFTIITCTIPLLIFGWFTTNQTMENLMAAVMLYL